MKRKIFSISLLTALLAAFNINAQTKIITPVVYTPNQNARVVVVQEQVPVTTVTIVNNTPETDDIYYIRQPRYDNSYRDDNAVWLVGTAAVVGGTAIGYHHYRHHRRHH